MEVKEKLRSVFKNKKRTAIILIAVVAFVAACFGLYNLFFKEEEKMPITGRTTFGALNEAIEGSGTTTPADSVSYSISGTVLEWYVEAGQDVKAGDLLYVLDSSEARDEMIEAEVELESLYEQLEELDDGIASQNVKAEFSGRVEGVKLEAGDRVQNGTVLATLVDDSTMKATLYFSYMYQEDIAVGTPVTASIPEQMLTVSGTVTDVRYVDYVTSEGMKCFAATISMKNPGSLTAGTNVTCWLTGADGGYIYAVNDAELDYNESETLTAGATGELAAVNVVDYQRVNAGETLFVIDASGYETQRETVLKQIENHEKNIADLNEAIQTEYTRYSDIDGQVVSANYQRSRMTGNDVGTVTIYNQESMKISVNIDELDADYLKEGMEVYLYRTTSSKTVSYPATLTYLSLEATSGTSGVSTFAAEITIDSKGELSSGVTVYYSIDTSGGGITEETVLAPVAALASYDDGYYLVVESEKKPENAIEPEKVSGSVTDYPKGYYAVPVEVGDYNGNYIQILSGVEKDTNVFLRYMNAAPAGGDTTSTNGEASQSGQMGQMPNFGGQMPNFGGQMGGQMGGNYGGQANGNRTGNSGNRTGNSGNANRG